MKANGATTTYRYDPLGRRIEVSGASGTRRFAYGIDDNAIAEYDGQNNLTATNTFDIGLDRPLARHTGGRAYYQLQDGIDNVTALTDSSGQVVDRYRYGAFGQPSGTHDQTLNPYTFAGREWDPGSDTYYFRARNYDPSIGRFLSEDPLPAFNPYVYASNSPFEYRDPSGACSMAEEETTMGVEASIKYQVGMGAVIGLLNPVLCNGTKVSSSDLLGGLAQGAASGLVSGAGAAVFTKLLKGVLTKRVAFVVANAISGASVSALAEVAAEQGWPDWLSTVASGEVSAGGAAVVAAGANEHWVGPVLGASVELWLTVHKKLVDGGC